MANLQLYLDQVLLQTVPWQSFPQETMPTRPRAKTRVCDHSAISMRGSLQILRTAILKCFTHTKVFFFPLHIHQLAIHSECKFRLSQPRLPPVRLPCPHPRALTLNPNYAVSLTILKHLHSKDGPLSPKCTDLLKLRKPCIGNDGRALIFFFFRNILVAKNRTFSILGNEQHPWELK